MPKWRRSGAKPSRLFASTVSSPSSCCSLYAFSLFKQADAAALLPHVDDHAAARLGDLLHRVLELRTAVALRGVQHVAGQALAVHPHEHRLVLNRHDSRRGLDADPAERQREVRLLIDHRRVREQVELAELGRQLQRDLALDELLAPPPVLDQVGDACTSSGRACAQNSRRSGRRAIDAVFVQHLAEHADFAEPREPAEIDHALGVPGPDQHAAGAGDEAVHVALVADEIVRARFAGRRRPEWCGSGRARRCRW